MSDAWRNFDFNIQHIQLKLDRGDDFFLNLQDASGDTVLMTAVKLGYIEIAALLLQCDSIRANIQSDRGFTALMYAAIGGQIEMVQLFVNSEGIKLNMKENLFGRTALILASIEGHVEVAKLLLASENIMVNIQCDNGRTALMYSCLKANSQLVKLFLDYERINMKIKDNDGNTALTLSKSVDLKTLLELHLDNTRTEDEIRKLLKQLRNEFRSKSKLVRTLKLKIQTHQLVEGGVKRLPTGSHRHLVRQRSVLIESINQFNESVDSRDEVCGVCLGVKKDFASDCGHRYCKDCIARLKLAGNGCAICREPITIIRRIY